MEKVKYVATIHFETDGKTDVANLIDVAADRMEQIYSVEVTDTHYEELSTNE